MSEPTALYHYTDRDSAAEARRDRVLRARPVLVRTALLGGDEVVLAPAVWFTAAPDPSPTVLAKLVVAGWPLAKPGMLWRFAVTPATAPLDLPAWAHPHGYDPQIFRWMLLTAHLAGEDWKDWRLSDVDVPAGRWLAVEFLDGAAWVAAP